MTSITPRVMFRPGWELNDQLLARGDDINKVARRCIERYLEMVTQEPPMRRDMGNALSVYDDYVAGDRDYPYDLLDMLERAHVLVEREGYTIETALREVGLTRG